MNEMDQFIKNTLSEPSDYINSYVAFLDMLGFKGVCGKKVLNCAEIKAIFNDIELLKMQYDNGFSELIIPDNVRKNTTFTIMSDSVVVSAPDNDDGLLFILYLCSFIQNLLLKNKILLRGGIARDEFFKCENIMFGPALVEAYSIESSLAIYPRIVLADSIINDLKNRGAFAKKGVQDCIKKYVSSKINADSDGATAHEAFTQIELLIKKSSEDSLYFVHYFNPLEMIRLRRDMTVRTVIDTVIKEGLAHKDEKIQLKYHWLDEYYRSRTQQFPFVLPNITKENLNA